MIESITLGGGCFWCIEAVYKRVKGVENVESGYAGGDTKNPSYENIIYENTGHAEVVKVTFDNEIISLNEILDIFFEVHNPTTLNRQDYDIGPQYRSIILYSTDIQKEAAISKINELTEQKKYKDPIVTEIKELGEFYKAEDVHQNFYENNKSKNPYCKIIIDPKISKLLNKFSDKVK
jgi:methionine-S-sulfoxide reductase